MISDYKGIKVYVYFNLHKRLWSIKALEGGNKGKVILHLNELTLSNAIPKVSEKGRQRVIKEKRKNVHAGIIGYLVSDKAETRQNAALRPLYYNPYETTCFVYKGSQQAYRGSEMVVFKAEGREVYSVE